MKKVMSQFTQYEIADHTARRLRAEAFRSGTAAMLGVLRRAFFGAEMNQPSRSLNPANTKTSVSITSF